MNLPKNDTYVVAVTIDIDGEEITEICHYENNNWTSCCNGYVYTNEQIDSWLDLETVYSKVTKIRE